MFCLPFNIEQPYQAYSSVPPSILSLFCHLLFHIITDAYDLEKMNNSNVSRVFVLILISVGTVHDHSRQFHSKRFSKILCHLALRIFNPLWRAVLAYPIIPRFTSLRPTTVEAQSVESSGLATSHCRPQARTRVIHCMGRGAWTKIPARNGCVSLLSDASGRGTGGMLKMF